MAYNEFLGERINNALKNMGIPFEEKKMMGGTGLHQVKNRSNRSAC